MLRSGQAPPDFRARQQCAALPLANTRARRASTAATNTAIDGCVFDDTLAASHYVARRVALRDITNSSS